MVFLSSPWRGVSLNYEGSLRPASGCGSAGNGAGPSPPSTPTPLLFQSGSSSSALQHSCGCWENFPSSFQRFFPLDLSIDVLLGHRVFFCREVGVRVRQACPYGTRGREASVDTPWEQPASSPAESEGPVLSVTVTAPQVRSRATLAMVSLLLGSWVVRLLAP